MSLFRLVTDYKPSGDQEQAIAKLLRSIRAGNRHQCLLGVTGSGKTFTMANIIAQQERPVLVLYHNKTFSAQLYSELKAFFPHNAVEYFVSYFDYYQPEAYIASTDTYIEKDSAINEEIDRLCLNAMRSLLLRRDVIVVASVSCIYGLGSPEDYKQLTLSLRTGEVLERDLFLMRLTELLYERSDFDFRRGTFRVRGDVVEVYPGQSDGEAIRVEFFGDEVERISMIDVGTGRTREKLESYLFFPVKQYVSAPKGALQPCRASVRSWRIACLGLKSKTSSSRRSALKCARITIWNSSTRSVTARVSKTIRGTSPEEPPAARHPPCRIISRPITSRLSTNRTPRFRRSAGCTRATAPANKCSSTTVSASPPRWTTVPCASMSLWRGSPRFST